MALADFIQAMPKVELNLSLEWAAPKATLVRIAERNDIRETLKHYADWIKQLDAPEVKRANELATLTSSWVQQTDDLKRLVYDVAVWLHRQNVRYAEICVNPALYSGLNLNADEFMNVLNDGRQRAELAWGIRLAWIIMTMREEPRRSDDMARWTTTAVTRRQSVVALGLSGREDAQPVEQFERAFKTVDKRGVATTARAGDVLGAEGVLQALEVLNPTRLVDARGIHESDEALSRLRETGKSVVVSQMRAVRLNWAASVADFPLRYLLNQGIQVVLGSDMPTLFQTNINAEYQAAVDKGGLTLDELEVLALNAVRGSFLTDDEKRAMLEDFQTEYLRLRALHEVASAA